MNDTFNEKSDTQKFWLTLIRNTFGIINPEEYVEFEKRVEIEHIKFIDAYVPSTGTIIEQKSPGRDLEAAFAQAKNYHDWLPLSQRGRYIITCDFNELHVHDMESPTTPPQIIPVHEANADNLSFLLVPGETLPLEVRISVEAGNLVGKLYNSLLEPLDKIASEQHYDKEQYKKARENINIFCVRLVFILYAEDSGLFRKSQFRDYLKPRLIMARDALAKLFSVLKTEIPDRDPFLEPELKAFPLVNGGLFKKDVNFPQLSDEVLNMIIREMSEGFNWSGISPVIFGAIFESTLNDETRKEQGMHYTSPANIHKIIDPLFLEELTVSLKLILSEPESDSRTQKLLAFQDKLAALRFLDPACGSGNFLTESFISLRRLENQLIAAIPEDRRPKVKVSILQFHGIESHDFAVNVARTALWISDHQMWKETQNITDTHTSPLPLKDYEGIDEGDAISADLLITGWKVPHDDMLYIMSNPPFLGYSQQTPVQKEEVKLYFGKAKSDYVACWFWKAAELLHDTRIKAAFVATNSLVQGEQVAYVFKPLCERFGIKIEFAYLPFMWQNELPDPTMMAHVHVVILGFSTCPPPKRRLYTPEGMRFVENINFYLAEGPDEDIAEPSKEAIIEGVPQIIAGNYPRDKGNLIIEAEDYADFVKREPRAAKFIRRYMMGYEFINNVPRYCLWLVGAEPDEIRSMPLVYKRVKAVEAFRLASKRAATKSRATTSWLFAERRQPQGNYIAIPVVSSERRHYVPMGWLDDSVITGADLLIIPDATLYDFGVLTSRVHMAWMRRVGGRLRSDYRYSNTIVYNTFIWPGVLGTRGEGSGVRGLDPKRYALITRTAQEILDARAAHPGTSFAGLYDPTVMPEDLRRAHERNDAAVCRAYGWEEDISEEEIVRRLFELYHERKRK